MSPRNPKIRGKTYDCQKTVLNYWNCRVYFFPMTRLVNKIQAAVLDISGNIIEAF